MSEAITKLLAAQERAMANRPKEGGFPYLAEVLRRSGVLRNTWFLPACESLYHTEAGAVVIQGSPLLTGAADVPVFNQQALVAALRTDQAGEGSFSEFLAASWRAGVVRYEVDLIHRTVTYFGLNDDAYTERYPAVDLR
jgi:uncharacterized protein YbcV (DUF1398 family)